MPNKVEQSTNKPSHSNVSFYDFFYANRQKQTYTTLVISIVLIIVFLMFALRPTITTIGEIEAQIEEFEKINQTLKTKLSTAQNLSSQINQSVAINGSKEAIEMLESVFKEKEDLQILYKNLESRAAKNEVSINSISVNFSDDELQGLQSNFETSSAAFVPSGKIYSVSLSLEAKEFTPMINMIRDIEGYEYFPFLSRLENFSISDQKTQSEIDSLTGAGESNTKKSNTKKKSDNNLVTSTVNIIVYLFDGPPTNSLYDSNEQ